MVQSSIDVDDKERSETLNEVKTNGDDNGNELDDCYESNSTNVMNDRTDDNSYLTFNNELNLAPFSYHGGQIVVPNSTTTIFAGDLAFFVTEKDLLELFQPFHPINVKIMRNSVTFKSMQYGFVEVESVYFAESAIYALNGKSFKGRTLRLNFAAYKEQLIADNMNQIVPYQHNHKGFSNSNSVHVKFVSNVRNKKRKTTITEELLIQIFSIFGTIVDCAIKESAFDKVNNYQYGYAFVHFLDVGPALTAAGVYSNSHLDHLGISIKCTLSKNLMRSMATTLNINLPFVQYDASHPYIMGYENYQPLPSSPYTIGWTEIPTGEIHTVDAVNISDIMSIPMIPIVAKENIVNVDIGNIMYEYAVGPTSDYSYPQRHKTNSRKKKTSPLNSPSRTFQNYNHFANF